MLSRAPVEEAGAVIATARRHVPISVTATIARRPLIRAGSRQWLILAVKNGEAEAVGLQNGVVSLEVVSVERVELNDYQLGLGQSSFIERAHVAWLVADSRHEDLGHGLHDVGRLVVR